MGGKRDRFQSENGRDLTRIKALSTAVCFILRSCSLRFTFMISCWHSSISSRSASLALQGLQIRLSYARPALPHPQPSSPAVRENA